MSQHDYVIANGTGAAVRSDLNNALAAIVSQNSGATAPATTYAYQWWADTTTGLLKLRNAANNAWITLFQLDGEWSTLAVENGSAAAPSIYFKDSGTDTGIYSPGADQVAVATNGSGRLFVDASGRVLVGTSSASDNNALLKVQGNVGGSTGAGWLDVRRGSSASTNNQIGLISFSDNSGNNFAWIEAYGDAASGASDYPGRLVFSTTADGAASPTERMRITNDGAIYFHATSLPGAGTSTTGVGIGAGDALTVHRSAATACFFGRSNDGEVVALYSGTTQRGTISIAGATTTYGSISDHRLKENVAPIGNATSRLAQLKPSRFNFVEFPEQVVDGFIAHEVQAVVPEAVIGTKDATDENGNPLYQSVDQSKLVPLLTAALQEAIGEIESLKAEVAALKAQ